MAVHVFRTEHSAADLRRVARQETGRVCQRLLLIANLLDGVEREAAARVVGLGRQAAYDWHNRYEEEGVAGLRDRRRAGRPRRAPAAVEQALVDRIVEGRCSNATGSSPSAVPMPDTCCATSMGWR